LLQACLLRRWNFLNWSNHKRETSEGYAKGTENRTHRIDKSRLEGSIWKYYFVTFLPRARCLMLRHDGNGTCHFELVRNPAQFFGTIRARCLMLRHDGNGIRARCLMLRHDGYRQKKYHQKIPSRGFFNLSPTHYFLPTTSLHVLHCSYRGIVREVVEDWRGLYWSMIW